MRAPPSVQIELGGAAERRLFAVLHGLAGAALGAWLAGWMGWPDDHFALALAAAAGALAGAWVGRTTHLPATGRLAWDGRAWRLGATPDAAPGRLRVLIDAGPWMALAFAPQPPPRGRARWLLVGRACAASPAEWSALRAAVYCRADDNPADGASAPDRPA